MVIVAALEGGLMLSGLYEDPTFVRHSVQHLEQCLEWQVIDRASGRADKAAIPSHSKVTES